jgi:hypothetical protein
MKNKLIIALLFLSSVSFAQDSEAPADTSYWTVGGVTTLTFSQVSLTNWASGGENSVSLNGYFNVFADYQKDKISWSNNLELGYGIVKQGRDAKPTKTDDIIIATTQFGYKIKGDKLFWSTLLDFRTQFYRGVNEEGERISDFMAPGYLLLASGLDWKPNKVFSITYAPVTGKFTFVTDQDLANEGAFGVDPGVRDQNGNLVSQGSTSRAELGSFVRVTFKKQDIIKNVNVNSKLELFTNYIDQFGNIDVNWQNMLVMKVNSFLSVNWQSQLIYDDDIKISEINDQGEEVNVGPKVQFKSVFGVGVTYKFGDKKE